MANGKVYVGTQNLFAAFGLGSWTTTPIIRPGGGQFTRPTQVAITDITPTAQIYYTTDGSDPTPRSTLYTGPFSLASSAIVRARAYTTGLLRSAPAQAAFTIASPGQGDGLAATYYNGVGLSGNSVQQVDPTINFNWNGASPANGIPGTNFSARWTGSIQPQATGTYTFSTLSDDGVRLYVNNQLIIDNWTYHGPTLDTATVSLVARTLYPIRLEYFQGGGGAVMQLSWTPPGGVTDIIPQSQLYSGTVAAPLIVPNGSTFRSSVLVTITQPAPGAVVYYTTDGSTPTQASHRFIGPFLISNTTVLKAKAFTSSGAQSVTVSALFTRSATAQVYSINCGGGNVGAFAADNFFSAGGVNSVTSAIDTHLVTAPAPQGVYQSERWGSAFAYRFTGLNSASAYTVRLHFAEIAWTTVGQRVFNVSINGAPMLTNFDIIGAAGRNLTGIVREFTVKAAPGGVISVQFSSVTDYASCSGIEIIPNKPASPRNP